MPASPGISTRRAAVQRPSNTALPPCWTRNRSARSRCWDLTSRRRPTDASNIGRPQRLPTAYPTLSPTTAPLTAAPIAAARPMRPWKASTPPRITAISPGNRIPTKADASRAGTKNTTDSAAQPCRDKMSSAARLIVVGGSVGLRSRAWPGSKTPGRHGNGNPKQPAARTMFPAGLSGRPAQVLPDPDTPHTYAFVDDFAASLVILGEREAALGEVWHVPSAETLTTRRFVELVFKQAGQSPRLRVAPKLAFTALGLVNPTMRAVKERLYQTEHPWMVDHSKFEQAFGAAPTPHPDAIQQTLAWYRTTDS